MPINVIIVDDHPMTRKGLVTYLSQFSDIKVVAEAADGTSTIKLIEKFKPNIVIMDISIPGINGIEVTKIIKEKYPNVSIIGLSIYIHKHYILEMLRAGALSYLSKSCDEQEILNAIYSVAKNKYYLPVDITTIIADELLDVTSKKSPLNELSPREIEVLQHLAQGKTAGEIAMILHISTKTVESHRINITNKTGIKTIAELARYAERIGLLVD